jgi:hypothetical protein
VDVNSVIPIYQWLATGRWFSPGTPVSSTNKTDRHDITEIVLNTINQPENKAIVFNNAVLVNENLKIYFFRFWKSWTIWLTKTRKIGFLRIELMPWNFWEYFIGMYIAFIFSLHGCDRKVVGFTATYAISAYHHWFGEFESRPGRGVQHYVIKFVSNLQQVGCFLRILRFPPPIKLTDTI